MSATARAETGFRFLPPALAEAVDNLNIRVRRPARGRGEGLHHSPDFGASVEFAEYRAYTPGDPPNRIDWAVYARSDRYLVRRFQEETSLRALVLLDASESLAFRDEGSLSKFDCARYLSAGLMYALIRQGDAAGLGIFRKDLDAFLPPAGTFSGLRPLLLALEEATATGPGDIEAALHAAADRAAARTLIVLVSDCLQSADAILRGLRRLIHDGHNLILLHVLDPAERRLRFGGVAELHELETGRRLVVEADEIRDRYRVAVERHIERLRTGCAECLGDYCLVDTREPVAAALRRLEGGTRP